MNKLNQIPEVINKKPLIFVQMDNLQTKIEELSKTISDLQTRLIPITLSETSCSEPKKDNEPMSSMANDIENKITIISEIQKNVDSILVRLQI